MFSRKAAPPGPFQTQVFTALVTAVSGAAFFISYAIAADPYARGDLYGSYAELARNRKEGHDFSITVRNTKSPVSILAIHGGRIEPGTSEIARAVAGSDFRLYLFEGKQSEPGNQNLHITSARFDEPRGLRFASTSSLCISIHGMRQHDRDVACIGGGNEPLAAAMAESIKKAFPEIEVIHPCSLFAGKNPQNIVNRCARKGVQLELSRSLRDSLVKSEIRRSKLADALRRTALLALSH